MMLAVESLPTKTMKIKINSMSRGDSHDHIYHHLVLPIGPTFLVLAEDYMMIFFRLCFDHYKANTHLVLRPFLFFFDLRTQ